MRDTQYNSFENNQVTLKNFLFSPSESLFFCLQHIKSYRFGKSENANFSLPIFSVG